MAIEDEVIALCRDRGATIALAESCTGGQIGGALVSVPGSSKAYLGGIVAYANAPKRQLLHVDPELLQREGAVSAAAVEAMAEGARAAFSSTLALGVSGIAGPTGGNAEKPAGTVFIALATPAGCHAERFVFPGPRRGYIAAVTDTALGMALAWLQANPERK